jgi:hypothetical protein
MGSNLCWCSDVFEITCWNGDVVRIIFVIDAHDREVLAWHAVAGADVSGSMVRDLMLEAVELRFEATQATHAVEWLSDKRQPLHRQRYARLRRCTRPGAVLHPGAEPAVERHRRSLRQNLQARLCSRPSFAGRRYRAPAARRVVQ